MVDRQVVGRSRKTSGARMVTNIFGDNWITVEGPLVRMRVGRAGVLGCLLLLRFPVVGRREGDRRVLDSATCFVVGGWDGT